MQGRPGVTCLRCAHRPPHPWPREGSVGVVAAGMPPALTLAHRGSSWRRDGPRAPLPFPPSGGSCRIRGRERPALAAFTGPSCRGGKTAPATILCRRPCPAGVARQWPGPTTAAPASGESARAPFPTATGPASPPGGGLMVGPPRCALSTSPWRYLLGHRRRTPRRHPSAYLMHWRSRATRVKTLSLGRRPRTDDGGGFVISFLKASSQR